MPTEPDPIDVEMLRRLRARHARMLALFLTAAALVFGGFVCGVAIPPPIGDWLGLCCPIGMVLVMIVLILSIPFRRSPCPRCGRPFYVPSGFWGFLCPLNLAWRQCLHCGLSLSKEDEATVEQPFERDA